MQDRKPEQQRRRYVDGGYVVALDGTGCSVAAVGSKAAGLDRLASHGFPIPCSYAVTMDAYRRFIAVAGLEAWLEELADQPVPDAAELDGATEDVERVFTATAVPPEIAEPIRAAVTPLLRQGRIAVRSSASAEDLGVASFAGQYRSFVGVDSLDGAITAVQRCWASLWLPAVRAYRMHNDIQAAGLAMGVIVQSMVEADWSGVGFTVDPKGSASDMRIEVVPGLGEGLVSGRMTPADFVIDRASLEITPVGPVGPPDFLEDLARMLLQVEDRLDAPQDVEWSSVEGHIALLQARPITVSGPTTSSDDGFDGPAGTGDTFTPRGVVEMLPDVVPPLLWTINAPMIEHAFRSVVASLGTVHVAPGRSFVGRFRARAALNLSALQDISRDLPGGSAAEVERQFLGRPLHDPSDESSDARGLPRLGAALRARRVQRRMSDEVDLCVAAVSGIVELEMDLHRLPARRLISYRSSVRDLAWRLTAAEVAASSAAAASYRALEEALAQWLGDSEAAAWAQRLTAGSIAHEAAGLVVTRRLSAAYERASRAHPGLRDAIAARPVERAPERVSQLGEAGRRFAHEVEWIVRSQGSRALYGGSTWAEDSTWAWEQLAFTATKEHRAVPAPATPPIVELQRGLGAQRRWRVLRVLTGQVVDLRLRWLRHQSQQASRFLVMRERAKAALLMLGGEERRIVIEGAIRLAASQQIASPDDVELLADGEFAAMLLGATPPSDAVMARRRSVLERCRLENRLPETFVGAPGIHRYVAASSDEELIGWAASPGIAEGPVKVVGALNEGAKLEPGDVLVAKATDPAWTPLLLVATGIVLEEGGPLSHGAIVAREFGVPAVLNVPGATHVLDDGEAVRVDGFTGTVQRLDNDEEAA